MNVFEFTEKSMGSEIPTLTDFKLIETSTSGCMITCQVDYSGDAYFEAEIGASFGKITIGIKDISFKGPLMIGRDHRMITIVLRAVQQFFYDLKQFFYDFKLFWYSTLYLGIKKELYDTE